MNKNHLFWIVPSCIIGSLILWASITTYDYNRTQYPTLKIHQEMYGYWACMDGCSNMQEIIEGKPLYNNETAKFKHDVCAGVCCRQFMTTLGCEK